jgi:hypothetical protein
VDFQEEETMAVSDMRCLIGVVLGLMSVSQTGVETIPQRLARTGTSLTSGPSVPSGVAPSLDRLLQDTDLIVRGVVGTAPRSYLSDDQTEVLTDYSILNPKVMYQRTTVGLRNDSRVVTVTMLGGTVEINGLTFTSGHAALRELTPGNEGVFCLKAVGNQNRIALTYFGAFDVRSTELVPLVRKSGFAPEARGKAPDAMIDELVARARKLHRGTRRPVNRSAICVGL